MRKVTFVRLFSCLPILAVQSSCKLWSSLYLENGENKEFIATLLINVVKLNWSKKTLVLLDVIIHGFFIHLVSLTLLKKATCKNYIVSETIRKRPRRKWESTNFTDFYNVKGSPRSSMITNSFFVMELHHIEALRLLPGHSETSDDLTYQKSVRHSWWSKRQMRKDKQERPWALSSSGGTGKILCNWRTQGNLKEHLDIWYL